MAATSNAMSHDDRLANAWHLLAVAAFAVYIQIIFSTLSNQLDASHADLSVHGSLLSRKSKQGHSKKAASGTGVGIETGHTGCKNHYTNYFK
jgi:hypothetical protein